MKAILALGNPGREYADTRHNVGWWLADLLAQRWHAESWRKDGDSVATTVVVGGKKVKLVKPQTFMNLSGSAIRPLLKREGFSLADDLLVLVDEAAIPCGQIRLRAAGSAGGHNGLKSIEAHAKTQAYPRLRIGVGPAHEHRTIGDMADYVLHTVPRDERELIEGVFPRAVQAVELWLSDGTEKAVSTMGR